jgi:drug/metabolite transporter (DMT)-like permease
VDGLALALVLTAAGAHAGWNLLAKQARSPGFGVTWLYGLAALAIWAPFAVADALIEGGISWAGIGFMAGSGLLHAGYFTNLQRSYRHGDLSVVYPLARGSGPVLSVAAAVLFLGERPSALGIAGGLLIVAAVLALAAGGTRRGIRPALTTGAFIAAYTVWDAHAVTALDQPPVAYFWGSELLRAAILAPFALRTDIGGAWRLDRRVILGVGALSPLAYVLVLFALQRAPISLVAPVRESSVVIGALLGARVLGEGHVTRRALAATAIAAGIAALALS